MKRRRDQRCVVLAGEGGTVLMCSAEPAGMSATAG